MIRQWLSPAKINIFLSITGRRLDGYHYIQTLFQFLNYSDVLTIITTYNGRIRFLNKNININEKDNLIIKAARLLQKYYWNINSSNVLGANIKIKKIIPIGSGLGGGSSNAATTLLALNRHWNCKIDIDSLANLGLMLGADVPVFIYGKSAFAQGIGDKLTFINLQENWYLIAIPPISINTKIIFNDPKLKRNSKKRSLSCILNEPFYNDCEETVIKRFFIIKKYLMCLLKYAPFRLTGTGACMFAEFNSIFHANKIKKKIPKWINVILVKGSNISPLHKKL
ncbi:MAG: 4-(cytidine 5'-diphospho)-2-C-methyl-D-erythritol kinase [Enterobacterales bacterium]